MKKIVSGLIVTLLFSVFVSFTSPTAYATHSWGGYHWARTSNPFSLKLGNNLNSGWSSFLITTSSDWSQSTVLDTTVVAGQSKGNCQGTNGRVEVCNKAYGNNGWLGIAQIWVSGLHITKGTTKLNDTYFNTAKYNTEAWKNLVMCQEVGHTFGLDHQDETFDNANLGTCMDYTNNPATNQHPNQHDYDELSIIYTHLDTMTTVDQSSAQLARQGASQLAENPGDWGRKVKDNGRVALFEKDFGDGNKLLTHVIWAE